MKLKDDKYNRQSIRLAGYDYSKPGYYFVTICTHSHQTLFGNINDNKMKLNITGQMIDREWNQIPARHPLVHLYEYVIMPNHLHGIIQITDEKPVLPDLPEIVGTPLVGVRAESRTGVRPTSKTGKIVPKKNTGVVQPRMGTRPIPTTTLSDIVGAFKSITTVNYIQNVKQKYVPAFKKHMWQQRFHDRIIRNENEFNRMRNYITENPGNWAADKNNPDFATVTTNR